MEPTTEGAADQLLARNPQQRYCTTFRREGIEITAGRTQDPSWHLALALTSYGYEGEVRPLQDAPPTALNDRVEYQRGPVTEWYVNRPGGLEQGFTVAEPEPRRSAPLVLAMAVEGDLEVRVEEDMGASFRDRAGQTRVRYAGLAAWDSDNRRLASWLEATAGGLRVVVDAGAARFPVTVDPIFVQEARLEGHGDPGVGEEGASAGYSVSLSGDTAVVGAIGVTTTSGVVGGAFVFVRSGTVWSEQQRLVASDGAQLDLFGGSVSVSGDTAVVGAPWADTAAGQDAGAVYVFVRSGTMWSQQQKLTGAPSDRFEFGTSVSVQGDTAVVGSPWDTTPGGSAAGSAHVFVRSGTVWSQQQKLVASDGTPNAGLGVSVSVSGDTAVVGANGAEVGGVTAGAAYVFVRSGTSWSQQQKLVASDGAQFDYFGSCVSVSGDTAVVAASYADTAGGVDAGAAYVFVRSGTVWSEQQKLVAADGAADDHFAWSVAVSGDTALVGAFHNDTPVVDAGAAYVFVRSGAVWSQQQKLVAADGGVQDDFGFSVSLSGDTALIGAYLHSIAGQSHPGAAYAFVGSGGVWSLEQELVSADTPVGDRFGTVSLSGDTLVVGALYDNTTNGVDSGSAYVFVRSGTVWSEQQKLLASDGAAGDNFGWSVSVSADTAVVGAIYADTAAGVDAGAAYVFVRSGTVWSEQQKLVASDGAANDYFGQSVSVSGDTVVIGASQADFTTGAAYVFVRSGTTWSEQQKLVASDGTSGDLFGASVSVSGDTAVAGAALSVAGSAYVFVRVGAVWSEQQKLLASDGAAGDFFGGSVSVSGDTALIGAIFGDNGGVTTGAAYVFVRSGTVWSQQQKLLASDGAANDLFGSSTSIWGNTAAIGVPQADTAAGAQSGTAYVFVRSGTVWSQQQKLVASDAAAGDNFGMGVPISGDTVAVGAGGHDTASGIDAGSVYVFLGVTATDAGVTKTDGQASAVPGTPVTYTLTVGDAGPDPGVGVRVVDLPPATMGNVSWTCVASPGSFCAASGSGAIDHTVNVDVGGLLTYTLTGIVSPSATGSLANTVTASPPPGVIDPVSTNNSATDTDVLTPEADLALSLADAPDPVAPGNTLTYSIQATNLGPSDSSGMTVSDTLPATLTLVSAAPGCTVAGSTVTCALGGLAPNVAQTVTVDAIVNPGTIGTFTDSASVAGNETDPVGSNDTDTETTQVSLRELVHGTLLAADLRAAGGILADQDLYRIGQRPYSSYEVVVDATSGDIGSGQGPDLERLASDAATVLQSSQAAGAGSSRSLRWENDNAVPVTDQYVRVRSAGCTTACTPEDVYRIRAWDTTLLGPRFNNSAMQVTVLLLQNTTDATLSGHVHFWSASGALLGAQALSIAPRGSLALNTSAIPGVAGQSGSLTLNHDAPYGTLLGKTVSVEPATGFTFDSPLVPRAR